MTVLYPKAYYNKLCYKGTAMYIIFKKMLMFSWWSFIYNIYLCTHDPTMTMRFNQPNSLWQSLTMYISDGKYLWTHDSTMSGRFNRNQGYQSNSLAQFSLGSHLPCLFQMANTSGLMIPLCLGDSTETEGTSPTVWLSFLLAVTYHVYFRWQIPLDSWSHYVWEIQQKLRVPVQQSGSVFSWQSLTSFISDGKYLWTDGPTMSGRFNRNRGYQSNRPALLFLAVTYFVYFRWQIPLDWWSHYVWEIQQKPRVPVQQTSSAFSGSHLLCLFQMTNTSGLMIPLCLGDSSETEGTSPTVWLCFLLAVTYLA